jgi:hypothetical protein
MHIAIHRAIVNAFRLAMSLVIASGSVLPSTSAQYASPRPGINHAASRPAEMRPVFAPRQTIFVRPTTLIFPPARSLFWNSSFYSFGVRLWLNPVAWGNCGSYGRSNWGYGCYAVPVYIGGGGGRELAQLYMKDGAVDNVTDYWVVDGQLHFMTIDDSGAKWNEHVVDSTQLDLQKTADVAQQRGFRFVLRNEPLGQYLRDHPEVGTSGEKSPSPTK